jgi:N-acetylglucosamine-6-phosphate deacetylase
MLYIRPAAVLTHDPPHERWAVLVEGERIVAAGPQAEVPRPPGAREVPAEGLLLAPGLIDLQVNGAFGRDFTADPGSIWEVAAGLPRYGVTAFLPTVITSPMSTVEAAQAAMSSVRPSGFRGAEPLGLHLEGPFLNPQKRGAHNPDYLRQPDLETARRWSPESGVRLVTLAPELPGALEVIASLARQGVVVSAGHSMASYDEAQAAFEAGATYGTHLFNAMPPLDHRAPGLAGALLSSGKAIVGIIADGVHVHPGMVALAWPALGPGRLNLVSDAMAALGMQPGRYRLGDRDVLVDGSAARLEDGRLAGSLLSMDDAVRNLVAFAGCTAAQAVAAATRVPAAVLGMAAERGAIAPGMVADMVLLTPDLGVATTIARGEMVYSAEQGMSR